MRTAPLLIGLMLATATSCALATNDGGQGTPDDVPLPGQRWALRDGTVTAAEYRTAVDRFISCVKEAGYTVGDPVRSPVDGVTLLYHITPTGDPAAYNEAIQRCNLAHLSLIEPAFVEAQRHVMDQELLPVVGDCLRGRDVSLTGKERNVADFAASADDEPMAVECVTEARIKVFPELPDEVPIRF
ncbi:hypothetical protein [Streptomyces gobiensis]|uniref:hypothetical protein n=1 Tax=Streptomyces gobiensis TaxID=2875706 RepID=UPI001E5613C7|nr:hypothetical protein [Streptomyces gobiensis]UGY94636.1 hypothetical protein test1122_24820 [Streptomyces gobiensis]